MKRLARLVSTGSVCLLVTASLGMELAYADAVDVPLLTQISKNTFGTSQKMSGIANQMQGISNNVQAATDEAKNQTAAIMSMRAGYAGSGLDALAKEIIDSHQGKDAAPSTARAQGLAGLNALMDDTATLEKIRGMSATELLSTNFLQPENGANLMSQFAFCMPGLDTGNSDEINNFCKDVPLSPFSTADSGNVQRSNFTPNAAFSFADFINPDAYPVSQLVDDKITGSKTNPASIAFIRYLTNSVFNVALPSFIKQDSSGLHLDWKAFSDLSSFKDNKMTLINLRKYFANASVSITSLLALYTDRLPLIKNNQQSYTYTVKGKSGEDQQKTGSVLPLPNQPEGAMVSPLQIEAYQATHRADSPDWIASVRANQSMLELERERVIIAALQLKESFLLRRKMDYLLANMAAMNANFLAQQKNQLSIANNNANGADGGSGS